MEVLREHQVMEVMHPEIMAVPGPVVRLQAHLVQDAIVEVADRGRLPRMEASEGNQVPEEAEQEVPARQPEKVVMERSC